MGSKRSRSTESEFEQSVQQYAPMIKRAESTSVKFNNCNCNSPVVVFAHGAGAPSTSEWMIRWRNLLANALNAVEVVTFDYPYISGRRKAPPKEEKLVGFHLDIVRKVAAKYPEHPLILAGKSMGSRISCMVAAENDIKASAVVCLGYPLKATNGLIRDEPLLQLTVPIMFVQGSNDVFCPLDLLDVVRKRLIVLNDLHVIQNGDHSFQIAKKNLELTGMTREEAEERAVESVAMFVSRSMGEKVTAGSKSGTGVLLPVCPQQTPLLSHDDVEPSQQEAIEMEASRQVEMGKPTQHDEVKMEESRQQAEVEKPTQQEGKVEERCRPKLIRRRRPSERIIVNKLRMITVEKDGEGSSYEKAIQLD